MKMFITIVAMFYCAPLLAQNTREIGVFAEPNLSITDVAHSGRIGIQYKHQVNPKIAYRFSASLVKLRINSYERTYYNSKDTAYHILNSWYVNTNMPVVSAGIQYNKKLFKRMIWYYGADVNVGFRLSKKDSIAHFNNVAIYSGNIGSSLYYAAESNKAQGNILYSGLQPFTGISTKWSRINTGIEISCLYIGSIIATTNQHYKSLKWAGFNLRAFVSYPICKTKKKPIIAVQDALR